MLSRIFSLRSSKDDGALLEEDIWEIVISIDCALWLGVREMDTSSYWAALTGTLRCEPEIWMQERLLRM